MLKKLLAKVGIGAATVRTSLASDAVTPGETVEAAVEIAGGAVEQEVQHVELEFETRYSTEDGSQTATVGRETIDDVGTVEPDDELTRTVDLEVPYGTPLSLGRSKVWLETDLEVAMSLDPSHELSLEVTPTARTAALFDALDDLGFTLRSAACEEASLRHGRRFVQEFEFTPQSGEYSGELDELEFVLEPGPDALEVSMEVDERGGMLSEMTDTDETKTGFTVTEADADAVADQLRETIDAAT